jgi:hypothetical protein
MNTKYNLTATSIRSLATVAIALLCVVGPAQATDYNIELIVYAPLAAASGEQSTPPRSLPDIEHTTLIGERGTRMIEGPRSLQAVADAMRRSKQYRLLLHWYWQQPAMPSAQAQAVLVQIPAGAALPVIALPENLSQLTLNNALTQSSSTTASMQAQAAPLLDGTLKFIAEDILHVDVDLIYRAAASAVPVQLKESRRLHAGELHYLDHSRFGVLVRVTPQTAATAQ